eukprot:4493329-Pyramimonas_sp.AAC.1
MGSKPLQMKIRSRAATSAHPAQRSRSMSKPRRTNRKPFIGRTRLTITPSNAMKGGGAPPQSGVALCSRWGNT